MVALPGELAPSASASTGRKPWCAAPFMLARRQIHKASPSEAGTTRIGRQNAQAAKPLLSFDRPAPLSSTKRSTN
eukprot:CAMPEP_0179067888 /NCGR_PEP_ID=MMETSP0796-20121207/29725_1 /TAXON_ID=73915 /ORGANISM="Pyrodinium bahamense, Strain pbaha01" /LENGTH=74 /DNA_ID=CAMNT_0020764939 /DNA_START=317 /DNA_END=538 /DNA_ORIENTATION=-